MAASVGLGGQQVACAAESRVICASEPDMAGLDDDAKTDAEATPLSPRSRRRRKNRDQMRLARQKKRETMRKLRDTLARLELRYEEALARSIFGSSRQFDALSSTSAAASPVAYAELLATATRLKEERFHYQQELYEKGKLRETLERVHGDLASSESAASSVLLEPELSHGGSFSPLSDEVVWSHIRNTHSRAQSILRAVEQRSRAESWRGGDPPPFFGWRVRHHVNETTHALLFSFDKPFRHVTALQGMQRMWSNELAMQSYRPRTELAAQSLAVLQHVNADTYVFQRRLRKSDGEGDRVFTSEYLRFRLKTAAGFAIGICSLDAGSGTTERLAWASKISLWTEFRVIEAQDGGEYCEVRMSGHTNLDDARDGSRAAQQTAAETVIGLLRWENLNIAPIFSFTAG